MKQKYEITYTVSYVKPKKITLLQKLGLKKSTIVIISQLVKHTVILTNNELDCLKKALKILNVEKLFIKQVNGSVLDLKPEYFHTDGWVKQAEGEGYE